MPPPSLDVTSNMFSPPMWYSTKFEQEKIAKKERILSIVGNFEHIADLDRHQKKKVLKAIFAKINDLNNAKSTTYQSGLRKDAVDNMKQINKFLKRNNDFESANEDLFKCHAYIILSRSYFESSKDENFKKSMLISSTYISKYGKFVWKSSDMFYQSFFPIIYRTTSLREHCIFLAWRVVVICMKKVFEIMKFNAGLVDIVKHCDPATTKSDNIAMRYDKAKPYITYAIMLLNNVIPAHMTQYCGNLCNQAMTMPGTVVPELNPSVASAFLIFANGVYQHMILIKIVAETVRQRMDDYQLASVVRSLNMINTLTPEDERNTTGKAMNEIVQIIEDDDDRSLEMCVSFIFRSYCTAFEELKRHVWKNSLHDPIDDLVSPDNNDYLSSGISRDIREQYISDYNFDGRHKRKTTVKIMRRALVAENMKNFLVGSCIFLECLLTAVEISRIDTDSLRALPIAIDSAKKVEYLLLPQLSKKTFAVEFIVWMLDQIEVRRNFCGQIDELIFTEDESRFKIGYQFSYVWSFLDAEKEMEVRPEKETSSDPIPNRDFSFSGIFDQISSSLVNISDKIYSRKPNEEILDAMIDEYDMKQVTDYNSGSSSGMASSSYMYESDAVEPEPAKPVYFGTALTEDDLNIWSTMIGYYAEVNNPKTNIFPKIDLFAFSKVPANFISSTKLVNNMRECTLKYIQAINAQTSRIIK